MATPGTDPIEGQYNKETAADVPAPTNGHHVSNGMGSGQQFQQYQQYPGYGQYVPFSNTQNPQAGGPHQAMISQVYQPTLGKIGNPGPLGLIGFALTTFVLGLYQCGAGLPNSNPLGTVGPDQAVFGVAVFFGGMAQFVAGVMEFVLGNTFGCTLHCSYGAFWLAFAMFSVPTLGIQAAYNGDQRAFSFAVGIFLIIWCFLTIIFFVAALKTNFTILMVLGLLALSFFFLSIAQFVSTEHTTAAVRLNRAGGAFAVFCAMFAFYAGAAGLMLKDTTFVTFPLGEIPYPSVKREKAAAAAAKNV
ncbi:GPR1/FUN34/yaaH family domain-containing protein [Trichoderma velutinum]